MNNNLELIFCEIKGRLREQLSSIDQLGSKFNFLLAFNSIIIASVFQGIASSNQFKDIDFFLSLSVLFLLLSAFFDLRGLILQKYRSDPDPTKLYIKYNRKTIEETRKILISNYIESFNYNSKKLHKVNKYFAFSVTLSSLALFSIFLFLNKYNIISIWETMTKTICQK